MYVQYQNNSLCITFSLYKKCEKNVKDYFIIEHHFLSKKNLKYIRNERDNSQIVNQNNQIQIKSFF